MVEVCQGGSLAYQFCCQRHDLITADEARAYYEKPTFLTSPLFSPDGSLIGVEEEPILPANLKNVPTKLALGTTLTTYDD